MEFTFLFFLGAMLFLRWCETETETPRPAAFPKERSVTACAVIRLRRRARFRKAEG